MGHPIKALYLDGMGLFMRLEQQASAWIKANETRFPQKEPFTGILQRYAKGYTTAEETVEYLLSNLDDEMFHDR